MVAADARTATTFALSPGEANDGSMGRDFWQAWGAGSPVTPAYGQDSAYAATKRFSSHWTSVTSPLCRHPSRLDPWEYDRVMYKRRNEVDRLFRRLKGSRRIFTRFDKLDAVSIGFITRG